MSTAPEALPLARSVNRTGDPDVVNPDRDPVTGYFRPGNKLGRGNPHAARVAALRAALLEAVTPDDVRAAVRALIDQARAGDVVAIRELLDRTVGKATLPVDLASESSNVLRVIVGINPDDV